jgi:Fe/S biogenesis protein NfuA
MLAAMVTFTEAARKKVVALLEKEGRSDLVLRFAIEGRGPGGFRYRLGFVPRSERREQDELADAGGFDLLVDGASAPNLKGVTVDYVETLQESGFKIDNPNTPWADPLAREVQRVLDQDINPAVAAHGGYVVLHDVKDGVAYVELHGGCQGCGMAAVTLRHGIEVRIKETVPGIREVVDVTNHAGGENPYYASAEGGRSPLE